jgi:hypothetical protein
MVQACLEECHFLLQALKYMDYIFTGVFTFEMVIKVRCGSSCSFHECMGCVTQACA